MPGQALPAGEVARSGAGYRFHSVLPPALPSSFRTSFGDITPYTDAEVAVTMGFMLIGVRKAVPVLRQLAQATSDRCSSSLMLLHSV